MTISDYNETPEFTKAVANLSLSWWSSFVDEGNMVTADPAGRGYLTVNLRQGRSLNSVLFFIDQQARGMQAIEKQASAESAEVNQFATVLVFKQRSRGRWCRRCRIGLARGRTARWRAGWRGPGSGSVTMPGSVTSQTRAVGSCQILTVTRPVSRVGGRGDLVDRCGYFHRPVGGQGHRFC